MTEPMLTLLCLYSAASLAFFAWRRNDTHGIAFRAALRSALFVGFTAWALRGWRDGSGFLLAMTETLALLAFFGTPRRYWPVPLALIATLPLFAGGDSSHALLTLPFRWVAGLTLESFMRRRRFPVLRALMHGVSFMGSAAWLLPLHLRHVLWVQPAVTPERTVLSLVYGVLWLTLGTWAAVYLVRTGGTPEPLDPPLAHVSSGPYRWLNHPMQWAECGIIWAVAFYWSVAPLFAYAALFTVAMMGPMRWYEERKLKERFPRCQSTTFLTTARRC